MSARPDSAERLRRLEALLARTKPALGAADGDAEPERAHLAIVPLERIREVTSELEGRPLHGGDAVDALTIQMLLNDYATAVAHLRAVVRLAESRVESASTTIDQVRRVVRRQLKVKPAKHGSS